MRPRDPNDEDPRNDDAIRERKLLNKLRLNSFTATPGTVKPFQTSTLNWNVTVPPAVSSEIDVSFTIGSHPVPAVGSFPVTPIATGALVLTAHSDFTSRTMGTQIVHVDASELVEASLPRAAIQFSAQGVKELFRAGSLTSRGDLTVQMLPPGALRLEVPLSASIPNFFDADIDVSLDVKVFVKQLTNGVRAPAGALGSVSVDVIFHILEHIFSLGTATAAQALIEPLAADLIRGFLGPQIETLFARPLQQAIDFFLAGWQGADATHRTFRLYSITAEPEGLIVLGAPSPAPVISGGNIDGTLSTNGGLVITRAKVSANAREKTTRKRRVKR